MKRKNYYGGIGKKNKMSGFIFAKFNRMQKIIFIFLFLSNSFVIAQENSIDTNRGTIKVQKKGQLSKVQFDNINYRLIAIDQYGNILDSAIVEFELSVTIKGLFYTEKTIGSTLTYQMQQLLGRCDRTSKIYFENIKAKDRNNTIVKMPAFQYNLGYVDENND